MDISLYAGVITDIKKKIRTSQYQALKSVNIELISLYRDIGKKVSEMVRYNDRGKGIVKNISSDIWKEFPGITGFSDRNIWYMKEFYETYSGNEKLQPLVAEISRTKNVLIMTKCKQDIQKEFYIKMTKKFGWTKSVLIHQIENQTYEKYLTNQTNFDLKMEEKYKNQAKLAVKDEYIFDFLELGDKHSERDLEGMLVSRIEDVLHELWPYFSFVESQYKLRMSDKEYFIDILLYHRWLHCLVALELKIWEFLPEYISKMWFYLSVLDDTVRLEWDNPSIGIILCKTKDRVIVEYTLRDSQKPIGVATYSLASLPKGYEKMMPDAAAIQRIVEML